jgi:nicotinamidase-related amidase
MSSNTQIYKILIVVDVQNCFIQGGSLGSQTITDIDKYITQAKNINNAIETNCYNLVAMSRDSHPINHSSLYNDIDTNHGVYPSHCRNDNIKCQKKYKDYNNEFTKPSDNLNNVIITLKNNLKNQKQNKYTNSFIDNIITSHNKNILVLGTDLSYLFLGLENMRDVILNLNNDKNKKYTICTKQTDDNIKNEPNIKNNNWETVKSIQSKNNMTNFIALQKGEYCDYESYSAFNYHIKINNKYKNKTECIKECDPKNNVLENLKPKEKYSTGLFEYIIKKINNDNSNDNNNINLQIDVCGLVTDICVINTIQQGLAMWDKVYKNNNKNIHISFNLLENLSIPLIISPVTNQESLDKMINQFNTNWKDINIKNCSFTLQNNYKTVLLTMSYNDKQKGGYTKHNLLCKCTKCNHKKHKMKGGYNNMDIHMLNCNCEKCMTKYFF